MRTNSASKKRLGYQKYIESRVLVSSHAIAPLSQNISSKLDLIKKQLSREFHDKFQTDRKPRVSSLKKNNSTSKIKNKTQVKKNDDEIIQQRLTGKGKRLNFYENQHLSSHNNQNNNDSNMIASYRDKYYELQDKLLNEKQKNIESQEKYNMFNEKFLNFIEQPTIKYAEHIKTQIPQRFHKFIDRIISLNEDVTFAENTLNQIMMILDVEDIQSLLSQLNSLVNKQGKYKGAAEYSFKILELQTRYNKLKQESQEKIANLQDQWIKKQKQIQEAHESSIKQSQQEFNRKIQNQERQFKQQILYFIYEMNDQFHEIKHNTKEQQFSPLFTGFQHMESIQVKKSHQGSGLYTPPDPRKSTQNRLNNQSNQTYNNNKSIKKITISIEQLINIARQKFKQMSHRLSSIERQAQQNMQMFYNSKNDIQRLQKILDQITSETQTQKQKIINNCNIFIDQKNKEMQELKKQLQERDEKYKKKQQQWKAVREQSIEKLRGGNQCIKQKERQVAKLQERNREKQEIIMKSVQKLAAIFSRVSIPNNSSTTPITNYTQQKKDKTKLSDTLGQRLLQLASDIQQSVIKKTQLQQQKIRMCQQLNQWQQRQLSIKQSMLEEFDYNLKKMVEDSEQFQEKIKKSTFQRDQYKFLLENLREQMTNYKKQSQEKLSKCLKQKDQQYLMSNRDILQINAEMENQVSRLKDTLKSTKSQLEDKIAQYNFYKKKSQNQQAIITQLRKKVIVAQTQAKRDKKCLEEIQTSFKQVERMYEINSLKIVDMQQEDKNKFNQIIELKSRNEQLQKIMTDKDEQLKRLGYNLDEYVRKLKDVSQKKSDLEYQNSELRLKKIELSEQFRKSNQEIKVNKLENAQLQKQNNKLSQQLADLTRKFLQKIGTKNNNNKINTIQNKMQQQLSFLKKQNKNLKHNITNIIEQQNQQFLVFCKNIKKHLQALIIKNSMIEADVHKKQGEKQLLLSHLRDLKYKMQEMKEQEKQKNDRIVKKMRSIQCNIQSLKTMAQKNNNQITMLKQQFYKQMGNIIMRKLVQKLQKIQSTFYGEQSKNNKAQQEQKQNKLQNKYNDKYSQKLFKLKLIAQSLHNQMQSMKDQLLGYDSQAKDLVSKGLIQIQKQFALLKLNDCLMKEEEQLDQSQNKLDEANLQILQGCDISFEKQKQKNVEFSKEDLCSPQFIKIESSSNHQNSNSSQEKQQKEENQEKICIQKDKQSDILEDQVQRVCHILQSLRDCEPQISKITYFDKIKALYDDIRRKMPIRNYMNLDISGVSFNPHTHISSPSSVSLTKDFIFQRRMNSQPNQQLGLKQTNRSDTNFTHPILKRQNQQLKAQLQNQQQYIKQLQDRQQQLKITIYELQKKNTMLQNNASEKTIEKLFIRFLDALVNQKIEDMETNSRTMMKIMGISQLEISKVMDYFGRKKKKKSTGLAGIFNI